MGTSSIYKGQGGKNKLLPDWMNDENVTQEEKDQITKECSLTKNLLTRKVKGSNVSIKSVLSHYIKSNGGSKKFDKSTVPAQKTFIALCNFLTGIKKDGLSSAVKKLGDEFEGKNVEEILVMFSNQLKIIGDSKLDAAITNTLTDTLESVYNELEKNPNLDVTSDEVLNIILKNFISDYLTQRVMIDLAFTYEQNECNDETINATNKEIEEYIFAVVSGEVNEKDFLNIQGDIEQTIEDLFANCSKKLEGN